VEARNLPVRPSSVTEEDGRAENRRVEISSSDPSILAPVILFDTVLATYPAYIRLEPQVIQGLPDGAETWTVELAQDTMSLRKWSGSGSLGIHTLNVASAADRLTSQPMRYVLTASDNSGQRSAVGTIPVERITIGQKRSRRTGDKEIGVYRLILFDFDRADISGVNRSIVDLIRKNIRPDATARYTGSTDRLGDAEYNRQLSEARAQAARTALGIQGDVIGMGEDDPPYDNSLPEGRFYSRTVTIYVENPVR